MILRPDSLTARARRTRRGHTPLWTMPLCTMPVCTMPVCTMLVAALLAFLTLSFHLELSAATIPAPQSNGVAPSPAGQVTVPLGNYTELLNQTRDVSRPAPSQYAFGVSTVAAALVEVGERTVARVRVSVRISTFEDQWTAVPVLPSGVAVSGAFIDGKPVQLADGPRGLSWSTERAGTVSLELQYSVDARRFETGYSVSIPVPRAASTALTVAGAGREEVSVVPASDLRKTSGQNHQVTYQATVPTTSAITLSWIVPTERPYAIGRAEYAGKLVNDALHWRASYDVELFDAQATLNFMPSSVTLGEVRVDDEPATVVVDKDRFATTISGRGAHRLQVHFQVPVTEGQGPPQAGFHIPMVPVSRFTIELPGKKEIKVNPRASVEIEESASTTTASLFMPVTQRVDFSWTDAIPEDVRTELRANATTYHTVFADEGVLHGRAVVVYDISRGETSQLTIDMPKDALVNRITSPDGGLSDWVDSTSDDKTTRTINVFLERAVKGSYTLHVAYERLLGAQSLDAPMPVPLITAADVSRQRGMVALLAGPELVLEPLEESRLNRVGENQLPAFIRQGLTMTVAHTYKYTANDPRLTVKTRAPERKQGKFDAQVDTLVSLGEVTLKGSATVAVNVKSGAIMELVLELADAINVLGVSGPSLRSHRVQPEGDKQLIRIEFTQEMEGQFPIEVNYELIMADGAQRAEVPTIGVRGAEVERGRVAVEALAAAQITTAESGQLSSLDLNELPQQLVLKTTNPILLAFKYVQTNPPPRLVLKITRHQEIDVQVAAIETADYTTLMTRDGLAVTTARFLVRNSRRQFLRLELPPESEVWSVFTNGKAEKPAQADGAEAGNGVLIKLINSATGFPVEIVYATRGVAMSFFGTLSASLPTPDMVVTKTAWDVYLPAGPRYRRPDTNLDLQVMGRYADARTMAQATARGQGSAVGGPLRIQVPKQGVQFGFNKLYANQSEASPYFELGYTSDEGSRLGLWLSILAVLAVWGSIVGFARTGGSETPVVAKNMAVGALITGVGLLGFSLALLGADPRPASALALGIGMVLFALWAIPQGVSWWSRRRANP